MEMLCAVFACGAIRSGAHWITGWMVPTASLDMDYKYAVENLQWKLYGEFNFQ